ncbi:hypothetical protein A2397_02965 [Candidatus Amesbacteria bacterium RIFOXYB1_FULL_44_23]|uniref:50S ribosomal protein L18 n=1 Tax=Candidatus Amesbacteria bacterium RIFOXYB1_FULL_44_23 TaxID=1797263 RepID=A0A1F4ZSC6_9BACT|nr:MAG: hypothetical protein A2397_02965 [Candidatus Amesbacteria bacterium RIFOXYB1_FULL_44_23]
MPTRYSQTRIRRVAAIRGKLDKTSRGHRLVVTRSNKFVYAQLIDLKTGNTVAGVKNTDAVAAGKQIAEKAKKLKIIEVALDRGGYKYHGKVKLLATAAREGGLSF